MTWRPSIRLFVPLVLLAPILAATAALITLSSITGQRVAEDMAVQWMLGATSHVDREVRDFLAAAVRTSDRYALAIERGSLAVDDPEAWHHRFVEDISTTPDLAAIAFATPSGDGVELRQDRDELELRLTDGDTGESRAFRIDGGAPDVLVPLGASAYDPRREPWYAAALEHDEPTWTPIDSPRGSAAAPFETGAGYARAFRDGDGSLLGVLVVDVTFRGLSDFLRRSPVAQQGYLFVLDETGHLVAASDGPVVSPGGERLMPIQSSSGAARSLAHLLGQPPGRDGVYRVALGDGTDARVTTTPIHPFPGVQWRIAAVVPETVFLEDLRASQRRATMIGIVAGLGAVILGLILARHIVEPILRLRAHTRRIGAGQLDARLELRSARELEELAGDLNRMAGGLSDALAVRQTLAIADEVQQSLLPQAPPDVPGLDVVGFARYCDATGGDYFDFIDLPATGEGPARVLVAVGDVMGHGVAAALLMATARAALRAAAAGGGSLGQLVTRVNEVLTHDARHGRFMTLALAVVEPETATLHWASAGHDPPIVIDPTAADGDGVLVPEGGDLPLGVESRVVYEAYRVPLPRGAVVLLATDGIWEARDAGGRMFGRARLHALLRREAHGDATAIAEAIRVELAAFVSPQRLRDDVTYVVLKLR